MKAIVWNRYGGPEGLEVREIEDPQPADNEIRVRVHATSVTAGDCEVRSLTFRFPLSLIMRLYVGLFRPRRINVLGQELAGVVDAVGRDVTHFKPGDAVFAQTDFRMGAHAEYRCFPANPDGNDNLVAPKPANLTFEQAAVVPLGGLEALKFLREAAVRPGEKVLIIGSGGSIGTMAIQLAKHFGGEVTGIDSGAKLDMMKQIGADRVIDYTVADFTSLDDSYDVIFDVVGNHSHRRLVGRLRENGRLILANPRFGAMIRGARTTRDGKRLIVGLNNTLADLLELKDLIVAGTLTPVLDCTFTLEQVPEAHHYVESGQKKGGLAITVAAGGVAPED